MCHQGDDFASKKNVWGTFLTHEFNPKRWKQIPCRAFESKIQTQWIGYRKPSVDKDSNTRWTGHASFPSFIQRILDVGGVK